MYTRRLSALHLASAAAASIGGPPYAFALGKWAVSIHASCPERGQQLGDALKQAFQGSGSACPRTHGQALIDTANQSGESVHIYLRRVCP